MPRLPKPRNNQMWQRGIRVKYARLQKGYSQADLGELAGLSRKAISDIECGIRDLFVNELESIAKALDKELKFFSTEEMERHSSDRQS